MRYQFMRFPGGKPKAFTMSYDDGVAQDRRFSDIISKYGLKCTFNLNNIGCQGSRSLSDEEIKEVILGRGHEIAVHGANHRAEGTLRPIQGIKDVLDNRLELEARFGGIVRGMAYPDTGIGNLTAGVDYAQIKNYLQELDIAYARTLGGDNNKFKMPTDWHQWMPTAHHNHPQVLEWLEAFKNIDYSEKEKKMYVARRYPQLFYLWGHSYEFDLNDNWDHLEKICQSIAGQDDIWYATNMEIYAYTKAYESLIYSADGKRIYNPTNQTVWLDIDRVLYTVAPGETIEIE